MKVNGVLAKRLTECEPRDCEYCRCDRVVLRRIVSSSGTVMYFWLCAECQDHARKSNQWIPHTVIETWVNRGRLDSPEEVPIFADYKGETRCVVCDRSGAEWHHWAPQSMAEAFGEEWKKWPGAYLCRQHHEQWHRIVTPDLIPEREIPVAMHKEQPT